MKHFNVTGQCIPKEHYMVNIDQRLEKIKKMVDAGNYFCINRGRQYGKTTTLHLLKSYLQKDYTVFMLSFENMGESDFATDEQFAANFLWRLNDAQEWGLVNDLTAEANNIIKPYYDENFADVKLVQLSSLISKLCKYNDKPIVLLIDEVDQASNYESFLRFLGLLRDKYLQRLQMPTFKSIILASVYDIRNLKLKMRPEQEHQYNSPWNIAVKFDIKMSLSTNGIELMLQDYCKDRNIEIDTSLMAKLLYDYTSGYPFLVSRLCQIMDEEIKTWNKESFLKATKILINEQNTLFDDIRKKLCQFSGLHDMLWQILYAGEKFAYNAYDKSINIALMFNFVKDSNGIVVVSNRIFEIWLYNLFVAEEGSKKAIYREGSIDKNQFINNGKLDVDHILERFIVHYNDIYGNKDVKFHEKEGRKYFMFYLKPIINGVGNMYVEAETRDETRTDLVIDYLGKQYIIELKIWRGNSYNERGEKQLQEYLEYFNVKKGYLLSFNFNKNKQVGLHTVIIDDKTIVEAVV